MNLISKIKYSLTQLNLSTQEMNSHGIDYLLEMRSSEELAHQYLHYRQLLHFINEEFKDKDIQVLKGLDLVDSLYESRPLRPFCDLDLLVTDPVVFSELEDFINRQGFQKNIQDEMSPHKSVWIKVTGSQEMVIELHRKLFGLSIETEYQELRNEVMLLYLIYHLVYQHTFLRLIWLCDIYLFLQTYSLDHKLINSYAKEMNLEASVEMTFAALNKIFDYENSEFPVSSRMQSLISLKFLKSPKKNFLHYHLIKVLSKNNFRNSASYYRDWIRQRMKRF